MSSIFPLYQPCEENALANFMEFSPQPGTYDYSRSPHTSDTQSIIEEIFQKNFSSENSLDNFSDSEDDSMFYQRSPKCENEKTKEERKTSPKSTCSSESSPSRNLFDEEPLKQPKIPNFLSGRKMADDSMRKKFKTMVENRILEIVNTKMREAYPSDKTITFRKLPQNYLKNATIEMNKMSLNMTLEQRFSYDFKDKNTKKLDHNCRVLAKLYEHYNMAGDSFLKLRVQDLIHHYIESSKYAMDLRKIEEEEGESYAEKFDLLARGDQDTFGYVEYYLKTPGNTSKKQKKVKI